MAIDFPNTPVNGTTYDYQGVRYIWKEVSTGVGYWRVYTPGTVGIATASEIDAGTEGVKYITPEGLGLSKYNDDFRQYGLGEAWLPFLYDLTGSVRAGYYYCPAGTPGNPDADPYIVQATNGEVVTAISDAEAGKIFNGWRTNDSAGAFTWRQMWHSENSNPVVGTGHVAGVGWWRKWANGDIEQVIKRSLQSGSTYSFPIAFTSPVEDVVLTATHVTTNSSIVSQAYSVTGQAITQSTFQIVNWKVDGSGANTTTPATIQIVARNFSGALT